MAGLRQMSTLGTLGPKSPAGAVPKPPPPPPGPRPLPDLGRQTMRPRGPRHLRLGQKRRTGTGGPGEHPAEFPGTQPEWVWYWASARLHKNPRDPRVGPFTGGEQWQFQSPEGGVHTRDPGSSVSDFTYLLPSGNTVIVRLETEFWHLGQGAAQSARDLYLTTHAGQNGDRVARPHDSQFMGDVSGGVAIQMLADILAGRPTVGQIAGGVVQPARYGDFLNGIAA